MIGIYKLTAPNGKVYIGFSTNIRIRFRTYKSYNCSKQVKLYASLKYYGSDSFKYEVIQECSIDMLYPLERYWQEYYNCVEEGLNSMYSPIDGKHGKMGIESIEKIRKANKGRVISEATRIKFSEGRKGSKNIMYNKTHTLEAKEKISLAKKGVKYSDEVNAKKGSPGTKNGNYGKGLSNELNGMYGKKHSESALDKMRKIKTGKIHTKESKLKMSTQQSRGGNARAKIVLDTFTGIYYDCGRDASDALNINYNTLRCKLNGGNKNNTTLIYV